MVVTVSHGGYVKRNPSPQYRAQRRGGQGVTRLDDARRGLRRAALRRLDARHVLFLTNRGRVYWKKVYEMPQPGAPRAARRS